MKNGKYIDSNGTQIWHKDGERRHRDDGPSWIFTDGLQMWCTDGGRHREDGPAIIYADGTQVWIKNGLVHREDGPAVTHSRGTEEYWIDGKRIR